MDARIKSLTEKDSTHIEQIADFLQECFRKYSPDWLPNRQACVDEVRESFLQGRRSRILVDGDGRAVGWIGAIEDKDVWEIHPIAVSPEVQRHGLGTRLVDDICILARESGAVAVWAGTSDETSSTTFSSTDLYKNAATAIVDFEAPPDHAIHFWLKAGFAIVGVQPDEEGLGKPGIHFAKRIV